MTSETVLKQHGIPWFYLLTVPALLLFGALFWAGDLEHLDRAWIDSLIRNGRTRPRDPRVVIVELTDDTRRIMRYPASLPRKVLAEYLRKVAAMGARVQIVDLFVRTTPEDASGEREMVRAIDELGNVILVGIPHFDDSSRALRFLGPLAESYPRPPEQLGHTRLKQDDSAHVRDVRLIERFDDKGKGDLTVHHVGLRGAQRLLQAPEAEALPEDAAGYARPWYLAGGGTVRMGDRVIPTFGDDGRVYFNFSRTVNRYGAGETTELLGREGLFETWPFEEVMKHTPRSGERLFDGRVVILGSAETALHDRFATPIGEQKGPSLNGQVLAGILDNDFLLVIGAQVVLPLCLVGWLVSVPLFALLPPYRAALLAACGNAALLGVGWLCYRAGLWLPVAAPMLTISSVYAIIATARVRKSEEDRRFVRETFSRYAPRELVDLLIADPSRLRLGGETQEVTILFADINGFTSITERQDATETITMLNEYFERMTTVVFRHGGLIKQFAGDEIMVIFGAPVYREDHARSALAAAWDMRHETTRLRAEREAAGKPGFDTKFGVCSGHVVLGNIGSLHRVEYGAVGDVVNTAARIMALNKTIDATSPNHILCDERTARLAGDGWNVAEAGTFSVPGKEEVLRVFELVGPKSPQAPPAQT